MTTAETERLAVDEAAHVVIAETLGCSVTGVYMSESEGLAMTTFEVPEDAASPYKSLAVAVAGKVAQAVRHDPNWHWFRTLATWFCESSEHDAKVARLALAAMPRTMTKSQAVDLVAEVIEEVAHELTAKGAEFEEEVRAILAGERTPRAPAGHFLDERSGRPVYFAEHPESLPSRHRSELPDVEPWLPDEAPKPKPKRLRYLRDSAGKLLGIGTEE
jgi:hypothetical protein